MLEAKNKSAFPEDDESQCSSYLNGGLSYTTFMLWENSNMAVKLHYSCLDQRFDILNDWKLNEWKNTAKDVSVPNLFCSMWSSFYLVFQQLEPLPAICACICTLYSMSSPWFNVLYHQFSCEGLTDNYKENQGGLWMPESDLKNTHRLQYYEEWICISIRVDVVLAFQSYTNHTNRFLIWIEWILAICLLVLCWVLNYVLSGETLHTH